MKRKVGRDSSVKNKCFPRNSAPVEEEEEEEGEEVCARAVVPGWMLAALRAIPFAHHSSIHTLGMKSQGGRIMPFSA